MVTFQDAHFSCWWHHFEVYELHWSWFTNFIMRHTYKTKTTKQTNKQQIKNTQGKLQLHHTINMFENTHAYHRCLSTFPGTCKVHQYFCWIGSPFSEWISMKAQRTACGLTHPWNRRLLTAEKLILRWKLLELQTKWFTNTTDTQWYPRSMCWAVRLSC